MLVLRRKVGEGVILNRDVLLRLIHIDQTSSQVTAHLTSFPEDTKLVAKMLKVGEYLDLSNGITLTIFALEGNRVKMGIKAPKNISIVREELTLHPRR